jgi:hypothetical protein
LFTSEDELLAWWPEGGPWVGMALGDLLEVVFQRDNDLVLVDPASDEPTEITRRGN